MEFTEVRRDIEENTIVDDAINKEKNVRYQFKIDALIGKVVDLTIDNEVFVSKNKCLERSIINTISESENKVD